MKTQMTKFLTTSTLLLAVLTVSSMSYAGDRGGNGGSGGESEIAAAQTRLENASIKIKTFFQNNETILKDQFPEFSIQALLQTIEASSLSVSKSDLKDEEGRNVTCLTFRESNSIECSLSRIIYYNQSPEGFIVEIFKHYLTLLEVKETSNERYQVANRLRKYLLKDNAQDLKMNQKIFDPKIQRFYISFESDENGVCKILGYSKAIPESMETYKGFWSDALYPLPVWVDKKEKRTIVIDDKGEIVEVLQRKSRVIRSIQCL